MVCRRKLKDNGIVIGSTGKFIWIINVLKRCNGACIPVPGCTTPLTIDAGAPAAGAATIAAAVTTVATAIATKSLTGAVAKIN